MNFHIINAVWGRDYINTFLELSLPTQFSSGNLTSLQSKPNYILYTDVSGKEQILQSPLYEKLQEHTQVIFRLIEIDKNKCPFSILLHCHSDAIKQANKLSAPVIFLAPDCILSTNVFSYLEKAIERKKRLITICSARMSLEKYKEIASSQKVEWNSRDLAKTTINHLHHRGKCLLMGDGKMPLLPSQLYWRLDENNLLAKAFHLHPLLIWPEVHNIYPTISADGKDFLEKICPTMSGWETIQDCSEISLFEISSDKQFTSDAKVPINKFFLRKWVIENTSKAHLHFIKHDIILGDSITKPHWEQTISEAQLFLTKILSVSSRKITHCNPFINKLLLRYESSLLANINKDFFKWHLLLAYYVITGKKKLSWKKIKHHFLYLFRYHDFPVHTLQVSKKTKTHSHFSSMLKRLVQNFFLKKNHS